MQKIFLLVYLGLVVFSKANANEIKIPQRDQCESELRLFLYHLMKAKDLDNQFKNKTQLYFEKFKICRQNNNYSENDIKTIIVSYFRNTINQEWKIMEKIYLLIFLELTIFAKVKDNVQTKIDNNFVQMKKIQCEQYLTLFLHHLNKNLSVRPKNYDDYKINREKQVNSAKLFFEKLKTCVLARNYTDNDIAEIITTALEKIIVNKNQENINFYYFLINQLSANQKTKLFLNEQFGDNLPFWKLQDGEQQHIEIIKLLSNDPDITTDTKQKLFEYAILTGKINIALHLLENEKSININKKINKKGLITSINCGIGEKQVIAAILNHPDFNPNILTADDEERIARYPELFELWKQKYLKSNH